MTYRAPSALLSLGAFKLVLDGIFHEFFGARSVPFIGYRGYEKDSSQYVKIMPIKHRQARKVILYKFHFLMVILILKSNSEYSLFGLNNCKFNVFFDLAV